MKTIQALILLALLANFAFAQTISSSAMPNANSGKEKSAAAQKSYEADHNAFVISQLTNFLSGNVVYPENMILKGVEGEMVVRINVSERGKITHHQIVKSLDPEFDGEVLKVLKTVSAISVPQKKYEGSRVVTIPLHFRLRN